MADLNKVIISGIVPNFDNAFRIFNKDDEKKAFASLSLSVQSSKKGDNGYYEDHLIECVAFGKTAQVLEKFATKGQGLILEGSLIPSRKRVDKNGADVLDAEGKPIYTGLGFSVFRITPMRNFSEKRSNGPASNTNASASAPEFDPLADTTSAAPASNNGSGSEDIAANWPF